MVIVLLMFLFLALVSIGLWLYTRTVITAAAADAARYVANQDIPPSAARGKVLELLGDGIVSSTRSGLTCEALDEGALVGVRCTLPAPGVMALLDGVLPDITVTGHSVREK